MSLLLIGMEVFNLSPANLSGTSVDIESSPSNIPSYITTVVAIPQKRYSKT